MFKNILVPLDGSDLAEGVLPHVKTMASAFDAHVTLLLVSEAPNQGSVNVLDWHMRETEAHTYLSRQAARLQAAGLSVDTHHLAGPAAERIVQVAAQEEFGLTILSTHGLGGSGAWNTGNITQKVLQRAMTSILLVHADSANDRPPAESHYRRILIPLDGSRRAECVLPVANTLARMEQTELLLAHVTSRPFLFLRLPPTAEENASRQGLTDYNRAQAAQYLNQLAPRIPATVDTISTVDDNVSLALHNVVSERAVDLVLMSAHGHSAQSQWAYGSVTGNFIANSCVPLLIVQDMPRSLSPQPHLEAPRRQPLYATSERPARLANVAHEDYRLHAELQ